MEPEANNTERIIGKLEAVSDALKTDIGRVLERQENFHSELTRHAEVDERTQREFSERLVRLEGIADAVDSHGDAILTLERWRAQAEERSRTDAAVIDAQVKRDERWKRGIVGAATLVGAASGAAGTSAAPGLWKWLVKLFGGH